MARSLTLDPQTLNVDRLEELFVNGFSVRIGDTEYRVSLATPENLGERAGPDRSPARPGKAPRKAPASATGRRRRRRASARDQLPDGRDVREFLARCSEGGTLTILARQFGVRRASMGRLLEKLLRNEEITLYRGAYYNNRRLRRRRLPITAPPVAAGPTPVTGVAACRSRDEAPAPAPDPAMAGPRPGLPGTGPIPRPDLEGEDGDGR